MRSLPHAVLLLSSLLPSPFCALLLTLRSSSVSSPPCRPREKVNRPQTRRRRENTADCQEKLRLMRDHLIKAMEIVELLHYREAKKRDVHVSGRA